MKNIQHIKGFYIHFGILQALYWGAIATFHEFLTSYLKAISFTLTQIGIAVAIETAMGFVGLIFWPIVTDRLRANRFTFVLLDIIYMLCTAVMFEASSKAILYVAIGGMGFTRIPMMTVLETLTLKEANAVNGQYSIVRATGSLAYALITISFGHIIARFGNIVMLIASETFLALCSLAIFSLSSAKTSISSSLQMKKARFDWRGLLYLFRQREMLLIIFFLLCSGIAMNTRRVLMPYIIARGGGTIADQGLACGLAAFLEVPAMLLLVRLRNDRSKEILAIVCILELAAYLLLTLLGSTTIFVVTYCITGFCYGLKMATARKAIYQIAPPSLHTSGQACADITYNSVSGLVGSFLGGSIADTLGLSFSLSTACVLLSVASVTLCVACVKNGNSPSMRDSRKGRAA